MAWVCLLLAVVAVAVSLPATRLMIVLGHRLGTLDSSGVAGQVKAPRRAIPNTGGVAIFAGIVVPLLAGLGIVWAGADLAGRLLPPVIPHLPGLRRESPLALLLVACITVLHVLGLVDDRRPLGPSLKLFIMALPAFAAATLGQTRMLTVLDAWAGGSWASVLVTVLWFLVVTNAMNFLDNMDGLSGGVAAIISGCLVASALAAPQPQWFVGGCLALMAGSIAGFLFFNFPPARIFMGDGGSLVIGFLLAFLSVRLTYLPPIPGGGTVPGWYAVLTPLVVLAIPLYDFASVVIIRLSQGRSPFVGDLQHFSHRLVRKGLSKRAAVLVIYGFTFCTAVSGVSLATLRPWQAALVGVQTVTLLSVLAVFEWRSSRSDSREARE